MAWTLGEEVGIVHGSELHAQAGVLARHATGMAALIMEGEAVDRANGALPAADALYRVVLAAGLRLTTDLDRLDAAPVPGWQLRIDLAGRITLRWPRLRPLLEHAPLDLPVGWSRLATGEGVVALLVGHHLGLHEHTGTGAVRLVRAAESGELAAGLVRVSAVDRTVG